jgi:hypothetical protein
MMAPLKNPALVAGTPESDCAAAAESSYPPPVRAAGQVARPIAILPLILRARRGTGRRDRPFSPARLRTETFMTISIAHLQPIIALIAGILILIIPRLLNFIVAVYLIIVGLLGLGFIH